MVKSPIQYLSGGRVQLHTKSRKTIIIVRRTQHTVLCMMDNKYKIVKTMNDETVSEGKMLIKRCTLM